MKVAAIVIGAMMLLGLTCAGAAYYWWQTQGSEMFAGVQVAVEEGQSLGSSTDQNGCLDESLVRMEPCGEDMNCGIAAGSFFAGCWSTAAVTPGFCDGAPAASETEALAAWAGERCAARNRADDEMCLELVGAIAQQCREG